MLRSIWRPVATVSILILTISGFIYYFATHPAVRRQLDHTSLLTLAVIFVLYLGVVLALSLVTLTTLRLCNVRLAAGEGILLTMYATVINFFGPLQSGPAFRGVYLKRKHGLNLKQYTLATLVFYALYALFSGLFLLSHLLGWWLVVLAGLAIVTLVFIRTSNWVVTRRFKSLQLDAIYALAAATLLQLSLMAVIYFVELRSIDHTISFGQAVVYAGAANFSLFVSLTPGAIGFRESFLLFSQRLHHISGSTIIAANIIDRAMYIVLLAVIGLIILVLRRSAACSQKTNSQLIFKPGAILDSMRLLVVEDELKIAQAIKRGLELKGFAVDAVHNGDDGLSYALDPDYDLIILDRMLPGTVDGVGICQKIRDAKVNTPILMLTARGTIGDRVEGLNSGADDYLVKPFSFDELTARVKALLRRPKAQVGAVLQIHDLTMDSINYQVKRGDTDIKLSHKEFALLEYLMHHAGQVITKEMIISHVWNEDADILPNTIEVYIGYLRNKIDRPFSEAAPLLHTLRGFGYKLA